MILEICVLVECDNCGEETEIWLSRMHDAEFKSKLESEEWAHVVSYHGPKDLCPECNAAREAEDETPAPKNLRRGFSGKKSPGK